MSACCWAPCRASPCRAVPCHASPCRAVPCPDDRGCAFTGPVRAAGHFSPVCVSCAIGMLPFFIPRSVPSCGDHDTGMSPMRSHVQRRDCVDTCGLVVPLCFSDQRSFTVAAQVVSDNLADQSAITILRTAYMLRCLVYPFGRCRPGGGRSGASLLAAVSGFRITLRGHNGPSDLPKTRIAGAQVRCTRCVDS